MPRSFSLVLAALALVAASLGVPQRAPVADAGGCDETARPSTLQAVINGARNGDVICMEPGAYRGPFIFYRKQGITLRGLDRQQTVISGGNTTDGLQVVESDDLVFEDFKLFMGMPANAYVKDSQNVRFERVDAGGGLIGIHYDQGSIGRIRDSFVYAMRGDGILIRNHSNVTVELNWVFLNGGVGVSTVGDTATTTIVRNIISDNDGPGVFAGQTPCALLPPGKVEVPNCYLGNLRAFVGDSNIILDSNIIQSSGSTGIVMFPGTRGTFRNNHIWRNVLSGLFVWGGNVSSEGDEYDGNEEHAIEFRAYPDPLKYGQVGTEFPVRAVGALNNNDIHDSVVLPETGTLGGGVLAQGANLSVTNSRIYRNRGIGVSYVNTSLGRVEGNVISDNRGSAICTHLAGVVTASGNTISGNVNDTVGVCHETTP